MPSDRFPTSAPKPKAEDSIETKTEPVSYSALMEKIKQTNSSTTTFELHKLASAVNQFTAAKDIGNMDLGELSDAVFVLHEANRVTRMVNNRIVKIFENGLCHKLDDAVSAGRARVETKEEVLDSDKVRELEKEGYGVILRPYTGELIIINPGTLEVEELKKRTIE